MLEGWEVLLAEGGERGLYEAQTEVPDVIALPIAIPTTPSRACSWPKAANWWRASPA